MFCLSICHLTCLSGEHLSSARMLCILRLCLVGESPAGAATGGRGFKAGRRGPAGTPGSGGAASATSNCSCITKTTKQNGKHRKRTASDTERQATAPIHTQHNLVRTLTRAVQRHRGDKGKSLRKFGKF